MSATGHTILFRLRHLKLPKASMGLAPLIRDTTKRLEHLEAAVAVLRKTDTGAWINGPINNPEFGPFRAALDALYEALTDEEKST